MQLGVDFGHVITLLAVTFGLMQWGIIFSCSMYIGYSCQRFLSQYTSVELPDPTIFQRVWEAFYERFFHPFGEQMIDRQRDPVRNGVVYQVSVGIAGMSVAISLYILGSWTVLGTMVASYYWAGFAPDLSSVIEVLAGTAVIFGLAVNFHAAQKKVNSI